MADKVEWRGASGATYEYTVFPLNTDWNDVAGNYIFAKIVDGRWHAIYIGETSSLKDRPLGPGHDDWECGQRNGMTHIHARTNTGGQVVRRSEEADLIANYRPPCNGR